jgi:hypothetical protein
MKMNVLASLRGRTREFCGRVLACKAMESPLPDLDLYEFDGGFVLGLFFEDESGVLSEADCLKATWLEIKTADPVAFRARLEAFGVKQVDYPDPSRFYFQAPGGQVFRLAPIDGGI